MSTVMACQRKNDESLKSNFAGGLSVSVCMRTINCVVPGLALLFLSVLHSSCRRENLSGSSTKSDSVAVFSATVDGTDWETDSVSAYLSGDYNGKSRVMTITGYTYNRLIVISLQDTSSSGSDSTVAVQSYPVGSRGNVSAFGYGYNRVVYGPGVTWQVQGEAVSGQASVTSSGASSGSSLSVSGAFSFSVKAVKIDSLGTLVSDSVHVTNGIFKHIPYTYFRRP